jgi:hypothetical protein
MEASRTEGAGLRTIIAAPGASISQPLNERYRDRTWPEPSCCAQSAFTGTLPRISEAAQRTQFLRAGWGNWLAKPCRATSGADFRTCQTTGRCRGRRDGVRRQMLHAAKKTSDQVRPKRGDHPGLRDVISGMEACKSERSRCGRIRDTRLVKPTIDFRRHGLTHAATGIFESET